jgi:hypothetical protein
MSDKHRTYSKGYRGGGKVFDRMILIITEAVNL